MLTTFNFRAQPGREPLYRQLADYFREEIRLQHLAAPDFLPSIRKLTRDLKLSRTTVEAAIIDGCSIWQLLFRILVPVAKPVISTALIMTFLACWNDFPLAKIMLNSPDVRTLSIAAAYFKGTFSTNYALMTAGCVILIIPQLLIFTIFQRYIISGVTAGAVKG